MVPPSAPRDSWEVWGGEGKGMEKYQVTAEETQLWPEK